MNRKIKGILFHVILLLIILIGSFHVVQLVREGKDEYGEIMRLGRSVATTLPVDLLKDLNGKAEDVSNPAYYDLKRKLSALTRINDRATFAYILVKREGKLYFMADSEPEDSKDCSHSGDEFKDATALDLRLFNHGSVPVIEDATDQWGHWISVLVPISIPGPGKRIVLFGMDFNAAKWKNRQLDAIGQTVAIIVLLLITMVFLFIIERKNLQLDLDNQALRDAEQELIRAKEAAEESDRLKTAFLKNISHEIRTPLNSIMGFGDLLRDPNVNAQSKDLYIDTMLNSGERLLNTIQDIIEMSRIQAGQDDLKLERISVGEIVSQLYEKFQTEARKKKLQFYCPIQDEDYELFHYTDVVKVQSILNKLLHNALKFTYSGQIELSWSISDDTITYVIRDTGVGIDPVQRTFIFDRFRQGSENLDRNYEGAGMGLSIARSHVQALGGEIRMESEPEVGSTFYVTLPYHQHEPKRTS